MNLPTMNLQPLQWRREVFYAAVDAVIAGINERFSSSRHVLVAFAIFSPKAFSTFSEVYPTTGHVEENVRKFCETYKIVIAVLLNFTVSQQHLNF